MDTFLAGQPLTITVALIDGNGSTITDSLTATFRVVDEEGQEILASAPLDVVAGAGLVEVAVPAQANQVTPGVTRGYRRVEVTVAGADGNQTLNFEEYLIEPAQGLIVMTNSFMTYPAAALAAAEIGSISAFQEASRRDRIAALTQAYQNIVRLRFRVTDGYRSMNQRRIYWNADGYVDLRQMSEEDFLTLHPPFLQDLRAAQVLEANETLDQFSVQRKRSSGLLSETIGESSMMFQTGKVLNAGLARRSIEVLRPYLVWEMGVARG
jgi:hypothetical protein